MVDNSTNKEDSFAEEMRSFPAQILLAMATNESATKYYRKAAVKLLMENKSPLVNHPELRELRLEIKEEATAKQEVEAIVESAVNDHCPEPDKVPFQASVTTKTLLQNEG